MSILDDLTYKQRRFCEEYKSSKNFNDAVIESGLNLKYSVPSKYYVYALIDSTNNEIFYIGKGKGRRMFAHGSKGDINPVKINRIKLINSKGGNVIPVCLFDSLEEHHAFNIERNLIKSLPNLTNVSNGAIGKKERQLQSYKNILSTMKKPCELINKDYRLLEHGIDNRLRLEIYSKNLSEIKREIVRLSN